MAPKRSGDRRVAEPLLGPDSNRSAENVEPPFDFALPFHVSSLPRTI